MLINQKIITTITFYIKEEKTGLKLYGGIKDYIEQACPDQYLIPAFGYDEVSKVGHNKNKKAKAQSILKVHKWNAHLMYFHFLAMYSLFALMDTYQRSYSTGW